MEKSTQPTIKLEHHGEFPQIVDITIERIRAISKRKCSAKQLINIFEQFQ